MNAVLVGTAILFAAPVPIARAIPAEPLPNKTSPGEIVLSVAYSPDRRILAVVDVNISGKATRENHCRVTLYDAANYAVVRTIQEPADVPERFRQVAFAPDGKRLHIMAEKGAVYAVDLPVGQPKKWFDADGAFVFNLSFTRDGKRFLVGQYDCLNWSSRPGHSRVALRDTDSGTVVHEFLTDAKGKFRPLFSPDFRRIVAGYETENEKGVAEFDTASGKELRRSAFPRQKAGTEAEAWPVSYSPDGRLIFLAGGDTATGALPKRKNGHVRIWDRETGSFRSVGDGKHDYFRGLALSRDAKRLYAATRSEGRRGSEADFVVCWDTATWKEVWSSELEVNGASRWPQAPSLLVLAPSGKRLWVADWFGLHMLDAESGKRLGTLVESKHD